MHKNFLWQAFLAVSLLVTVGYSIVGLYQYYSYARLSDKTSDIVSMHWKISQKSEENFIVGTDYVFRADDKEFKGEANWAHESYLNKYAANHAIEEMVKKNWEVWYDATNPNHSALQKDFPFKALLSAFFLWALFLYFIWLGYYVGGFKKS